MDPCVLYRRTGNNLDALTELQVDDSFGHVLPAFLDREEKLCCFKSKPHKLLVNQDGCVSNGVYIKRKMDVPYCITQAEKLKALKMVMNAEEFKSVRAAAQYIGNCVRPDICAAVQLLPPGSRKPSENQMKGLNDIAKHCHTTNEVRIRYVPLELSSVSLIIFTDASFANAADFKSQLGYVLLMVDGTGKAHILHYGSSRRRRFTRSVMAAEIHALFYGFDNAYMAKDMVSEVLGRTIPVDGYIDSRTLLNKVGKEAKTLEKRLQIGVSALRESHELGEFRSLAWIPSKQNIADAMTKACKWKFHSLWDTMKTN